MSNQQQQRPPNHQSHDRPPFRHRQQQGIGNNNATTNGQHPQRDTRHLGPFPPSRPNNNNNNNNNNNFNTHGGRQRGGGGGGGFPFQRGNGWSTTKTSGMRQTNDYHQRQQDLARAVAQRKLQRQHQNQNQQQQQQQQQQQGSRPQGYNSMMMQQQRNHQRPPPNQQQQQQQHRNSSNISRFQQQQQQQQQHSNANRSSGYQSSRLPPPSQASSGGRPQPPNNYGGKRVGPPLAGRTIQTPRGGGGGGGAMSQNNNNNNKNIPRAPPPAAPKAASSSSAEGVIDLLSSDDEEEEPSSTSSAPPPPPNNSVVQYRSKTSRNNGDDISSLSRDGSSSLKAAAAATTTTTTSSKGKNLQQKSIASSSSSSSGKNRNSTSHSSSSSSSVASGAGAAAATSTTNNKGNRGGGSSGSTTTTTSSRDNTTSTKNGGKRKSTIGGEEKETTTTPSNKTVMQLSSDESSSSSNDDDDDDHDDSDDEVEFVAVAPPPPRKTTTTTTTTKRSIPPPKREQQQQLQQQKRPIKNGNASRLSIQPQSSEAALASATASAAPAAAHSARKSISSSSSSSSTTAAAAEITRNATTAKVSHGGKQNVTIVSDLRKTGESSSSATLLLKSNNSNKENNNNNEKGKIIPSTTRTDKQFSSTKTAAGNTKNITSEEDDDDDDGSTSDIEIIDGEDRSSYYSSSDDDDDDDDDDNNATRSIQETRFPMKMARKSSVMSASSSNHRKSAPTMRGMAKAPVQRRRRRKQQQQRQRPKHRLYLESSSDSEEEDSEVETSSSGSSSSNDDDDDDSSESESETGNDEESFDSLGQPYSRNDRFGQKRAADSVVVVRQKQSARKSALNGAPNQSSQSMEGTGGRHEAVISPFEDTEESVNSSKQQTKLAETSSRIKAKSTSQGNLSEYVGAAKKNRKKRKRGDDDHGANETHGSTTLKPKEKRQRSRARVDSEESEASTSDVLAASRSSNLKSPSPLLKRRCSNSAPLHFSPLESPHATTGKSDGDTDRLMIQVDHLNKLATNQVSGLPYLKMTVHAEDAEILYDFRVDVATSGIPNAGNGAFLTFLGARHLKDEAFSKSPQKLVQKELIFDDDLEAVDERGFGVHVKLTGESVDPQKAQRPRGIGPKGVFDESDYEASPSTVFSSRGKGNGLVYLGRYGPFRALDRKPVTQFDVKSFILGYEPSEWCFGVDEKLFGREDQIIDITDDLTGKPHELAQENIPMHVNEVGHNKNLVQNVESRTLHDRSVHYYIKIEEPMKKGDRVELLTDYFATYEDIRLRKGYGKGNLKEGLNSDEDPKARYERNVDLRNIVCSRVRDLDIFSSYQLLEFIEETIHQPLVNLVGRFLEVHAKGDTVPAPLCQQCVALIRLRFFGGTIFKHLVDLEEKLKRVRNIMKGYPWREMLQQCKLWAQGMKSIDMSGLWQLSNDVNDAEGKSIHKALRSEILELRWRDLKRELQCPYDPGMWCPIAVGMIDELSWAITTKMGSKKESLMETLYGIASKTADTIRKEAAKNTPSNDSALAFDPGVKSDLAFVSAKQVPALKATTFEGNSLNPKGVLAGVAELLVYCDLAYLQGFASSDLSDSCFSVPIDPKKRLVMTKFEGFRNCSPLCSVPKSADDCMKVNAEINIEWYLLWQVVYVANSYASVFLIDDSDCYGVGYSLQELCRRVGVDYSLAQPAIIRGIRRQKVEAKLRKKKKSSKTRGPKSKKATSKSKKSPEAKRKPAIEISCGEPDEPIEGGWPPGWKKRVFERQSGDSQGHRDRYWYTPQHQYKLRSMKDVKKFLACLRTVGNNEELAWKFFRQSST